MQTSITITPIIHPKRNRKPKRSWKHRRRDEYHRFKWATQYRVVAA